MSEGEKIVAVGLMTEADLKSWGHKLQRVHKAETTLGFDDLLRAIDEAETQGNSTSKY